MAGVKGKSGGKRPGAGRKPRAVTPLPPPPADTAKPGDAPAPFVDDPKAFLLAAMNNTEADARLRLEAAKVLMPFVHQKKGESGKKGEKEKAALAAAAGRFKSAAAPRLVVNNK